MAIQKKVDTWKLKKWFSVYAPKAFNSALVGEMPANDEKAALGRTIVVSLDQMTHNPSHAYTNAVLKVTTVDGSSAQTKLIRLEQLYSYIRSLVRRYRSVSAAVIPVQTKDGISMVVKLLVITRARTTHSRTLGIRKEMTGIVKAFAGENDAESVVGAVVEGKLQAELASKLDHIAPLNKIEVRKLEIKA